MTKLYSIAFFLTALLVFSKISKGQAQSGNYPKVAGYFSVLHPLGTWNKNGFTGNFGNVYTVGFPFGINILKSDRFGVSIEMVPLIRTERNISKVNTVLFHPGAMFRFKHGFTFIGRMAFETNGRFGVTPVINQMLVKGKDASFFVSVPVPVRFGNDLPASVTAGLQFGVAF